MPVVLNIVLWSAQHDAKSYVRPPKDFVARISQNSIQVSEEVKALVRKGGCVFPESTDVPRSEEHTSELQSLMRISYAVFCLKKKTPLYHLSHLIINNTSPTCTTQY